MNTSAIDLDRLLRRLHLPTVRRLYVELETRAEKEEMSYRDYLAILIAEEVAQRRDPGPALGPPSALPVSRHHRRVRFHLPVVGASLINRLCSGAGADQRGKDDGAVRPLGHWQDSPRDRHRLQGDSERRHRRLPRSQRTHRGARGDTYRPVEAKPNTRTLFTHWQALVDRYGLRQIQPCTFDGASRLALFAVLVN